MAIFTSWRDCWCWSAVLTDFTDQLLTSSVSRSVTAPFDRLKIYLITTDNTALFTPATSSTHPISAGRRAVGNLWGAVVRIYADGGGLRAFWVGNGLNVIKIFPVRLYPLLLRLCCICSFVFHALVGVPAELGQESAIKFVSYEQSKKFLAKYWDKVSDPSELSSSSRFFAGGIGGITSQFSIYGLETLKTRIQSEVGPAQGMKAVMRTAGDMWRTGGIRAYYRGLTVGVQGFPVSRGVDGTDAGSLA